MSDNFKNATMIMFMNRLTQLGVLDLWLYVANHNPSRTIAYHNNQHMLYMAWLADQFYQSHSSETQGTGDLRNMVAAALFHDYDHTAGVSPDPVNIERAVAGWRVAYAAIQPKDIDPAAVEALIRITEYPYTGPVETLEGKCLRDADLLYTTVMGDPFVVLRDLKSEMETRLGRTFTQEEMANGYKDFIRKAELHTETAKLLRLCGFPVFLLSMALRCDGVQVIAPEHAEEWLKG